MSAGAQVRPIWWSAGKTFENAGSRVADFLVASVPALTPQTLAVARMLFGSLILFYWLQYEPGAFADLAVAGAKYPSIAFLDGTGVLTLISGNDLCRLALYWGTIGLLACFIVGFQTRFLYAPLVACMWLFALLGNQGHFITPLLLAMTATLGSPWSARWSFDSILYRKRGIPRAASAMYGYPVWLLGLTIGLTYAAAGFSKIILTNGDWLLHTGARNGFLQDFNQAITDWGMWISNDYYLSLWASFISAVGQVIYLYACFTRSWKVKYAICFLIALPFLFGLMLLMGLFWWPWAVLVLMLYFPWRTLDKYIAPNAPILAFSGAHQDAHRRWFVTGAVTLIAVHTYAVISAKEVEPFWSNYPMYADRMLAGSTHESDFWAKWRTYDRNYQNTVELVSKDANGKEVMRRDLSLEYRAAAVMAAPLPFFAGISKINVLEIWKATLTDARLTPGHCQNISSTLSSYLEPVAHSQVLLIGRRYIEIVDGQVVWNPQTRWIEVNLTTPGCDYQLFPSPKL